MAVVIASQGTQATGNSNDALSPAKPSGTVSGDLLLMLWAASDLASLPTLSTPSGWTAGPTAGGGATPQMKSAIFHKIAGGSEPSSYTLTDLNLFNGAGQTAVILRITGHHPTLYWHQTASSGLQSFVAPSVTTTLTNCLLLCFAVDGRPSSTLTFTAPSGMTEQYDFGVVPSHYSNSQTCAYKALTAAGATGTQTFGGSDQASSNTHAHTVAIAPASLSDGWGMIPIN